MWMVRFGSAGADGPGVPCREEVGVPPWITAAELGENGALPLTVAAFLP